MTVSNFFTDDQPQKAPGNSYPSQRTAGLVPTFDVITPRCSLIYIHLKWKILERMDVIYDIIIRCCQMEMVFPKIQEIEGTTLDIPSVLLYLKGVHLLSDNF